MLRSFNRELPSFLFMFNKLINTLKYSTKILVIINTNHKNSIFEREDVIWSTLSALQPLKICLKFDSNKDRDWHYTEKKMNSNLTSAYCSYSLDYHSQCFKRFVYHFMTYETKSDKLTC